jgi:hypothetical protein
MKSLITACQWILSTNKCKYYQVVLQEFYEAFLIDRTLEYVQCQDTIKTKCRQNGILPTLQKSCSLYTWLTKRCSTWSMNIGVIIDTSLINAYLLKCPDVMLISLLTLYARSYNFSYNFCDFILFSTRHQRLRLKLLITSAALPHRLMPTSYSLMSDQGSTSPWTTRLSVL